MNKTTSIIWKKINGKSALQSVFLTNQEEQQAERSQTLGTFYTSCQTKHIFDKTGCGKSTCISV